MSLTDKLEGCRRSLSLLLLYSFAWEVNVEYRAGLMLPLSLSVSS